MLKQAVWFALILSQCLAAAQNHLRGGLIPSRPEDHSPSVIPAAIPHLQCVSTGYVGNRVNLVVGPDGVFRLNRKLLMSGPITTQARNLYAWGQVRVVERVQLAGSPPVGAHAFRSPHGSVLLNVPSLR